MLTKESVLLEAVATCINVHRSHAYLQGRNGIGGMRFLRVDDMQWFGVDTSELPAFHVQAVDHGVSVE